jgi:hypothetical protein
MSVRLVVSELILTGDRLDDLTHHGEGHSYTEREGISQF